MKKSKTFFACAMLAALASCSNDHVLSQQSPTPSDPDVINIVAASSKPVTKAAGTADDLQDTQFAENALINVYLSEHIEGSESASMTYNDGNAYKYKVTSTPIGSDGTGRKMVLNDSGTDPHFPANGRGVDAYALYPAIDETGYNIDKDVTKFEVKKNQSLNDDYLKSDLMFGRNGLNSTDGSVISDFKGTTKGNNVELYFRHQLSKIIVKLSKSSEMADGVLNGATIKLCNVKPKASFAVTKTGLSNLKAADTDNDATEITVGNYNAAGNAAIIVPQDIVVPTGETKTKFIEIKLSETNGSTVYVYNIADADESNSDGRMTFASGKSYTYNITLSAGNIVVVSTKIADWEDKQIAGDAELKPAS